MNSSHSKQHLQALDRAHHLHPFTDFHDLSERGTRVISRAELVTRPAARGSAR